MHSLTVDCWTNFGQFSVKPYILHSFSVILVNSILILGQIWSFFCFFQSLQSVLFIFCPFYSHFLFIGVDVSSTFAHLLKSEPELATGVAVIKTLILVLEKCAAKTLQELIKILKGACNEMKTQVDCSACSVTSGGELFLRFITLASKLEEEVSIKKIIYMKYFLRVFFKFFLSRLLRQ